jgi:non-ribosomal peptide synthetase component E (peptide arylation enzyme)
MPDPIMGEKGCAYVVPKEGEQISFDEMVLFLKGKGLAPFKIPERIEVLSELPVVPGGMKIDKRSLEADIAVKLRSEGKL